MNDQVVMNTHTGGGFFAGLKRSLTGGSFLVTDFTAQGQGHVAFAPRFPGAIIPAMLRAGQSAIRRQETFLVARSLSRSNSPGRSGSAPASSAATASSCKR